jgi:hypothetical protein
VRPRIKGRFATREEVLALKAQQQQQTAQQLPYAPQQDEDDLVVPSFT